MKSNEKCILKILKIHGNGLFTNEILQLTKNYPNLCKGCSSGNHIISSGLEVGPHFIPIGFSIPLQNST